MSEQREDIIRKAFSKCTWGNTTETPEEWIDAFESKNEEAKRRVFDLMFRESADSHDIKDLFGEDEIRGYLSRYTKPFRFAHAEKRRKVWRYVYLGIREPVPELDWIVKVE